MDYGKYLVDKILPYWLEISKDAECGGVYTSFDENGKVANTNKHTWFLGRELWTYSMAWRLVEEKAEFLDMCESIYQFLRKITPPDGRLPLSVTREGEPISSQGSNYYSEMYAAMGCAQYYRICKREEVWELANLFFDLSYDYYKAHRSITQSPGAKEPCKLLGLQMCMLPAAQFMRNVGRDTEKFDEAAALVIEEIRTSGFIDEKRKQVHDVAPINTPEFESDMKYLTCPAQTYELAWFVLREGEVKDDDSIRELGKKLVDFALPEGFDEKFALLPTVTSLARSLEEEFAEPRKYDDWAQWEGICAFRIAHSIFGDERYLKLARKYEKASFEYFVDEKLRRWHSTIDINDGKACERKTLTPHTSGPFHLERSFLAMYSLDKTGNILYYMS